MNVINRYVQAFENAEKAGKNRQKAENNHHSFRFSMRTALGNSGRNLAPNQKMKLNMYARLLEKRRKEHINAMQKLSNLYEPLRQVIRVPNHHFRAGSSGGRYEVAYHQALNAKRFLNRQKFKTLAMGLNWKQKAHTRATVKAAHIGLVRAFAQRKPESVQRSELELPMNVLRRIMEASNLRGNKM